MTTNSTLRPQNTDSATPDKNILTETHRGHPRDNNDPRNKQPRRDRRDVHGWVVLDKPVGMTSTQAVAIVKRLFQAKRAGHAGTLDPLASGGLPIALGEATKTVPFVMDGRKRYRFTVCWGEERDTDDTEGRVVHKQDQDHHDEQGGKHCRQIQASPGRHAYRGHHKERRRGGQTLYQAP